MAAKSAIPRPATPLIGRAREVETVSSLLTTPDVRLVTLTGLGGVGKTRLAVALARQLQDEFPGGVFMARLAGVSDPASILPMIAEQVGIMGPPSSPSRRCASGRRWMTTRSVRSAQDR